MQVYCIQSKSEIPSKYFGTTALKPYFGLTKPMPRLDPDTNNVTIIKADKPSENVTLNKGTYTVVDKNYCFPANKEKFCTALNIKYSQRFFNFKLITMLMLSLFINYRVKSKSMLGKFFTVKTPKKTYRGFIFYEMPAPDNITFFIGAIYEKTENSYDIYITKMINSANLELSDSAITVYGDDDIPDEYNTYIKKIRSTTNFNYSTFSAFNGKTPVATYDEYITQLSTYILNQIHTVRGITISLTNNNPKTNADQYRRFAPYIKDLENGRGFIYKIPSSNSSNLSNNSKSISAYIRSICAPNNATSDTSYLPDGNEKNIFSIFNGGKYHRRKKSKKHTQKHHKKHTQKRHKKN